MCGNGFRPLSGSVSIRLYCPIGSDLSRRLPVGLIWAAERSLQLFTDETILPTRFSLLATPVTRAMAESAFNRLDPNTYSSGDLFAAGWADHGIGPLVCVGQGTGAGGANVWGDVQLSEALMGTAYEFDPLPDGIHITMAIRRAIRSGRSDGVPIEDLGIRGIPYALTRRDLLEGNRDLLSYCAQTLHDWSWS